MASPAFRPHLVSCFLPVLVLCVFLAGPPAPAEATISEGQLPPSVQTAKDVYYQTDGQPSGPPARIADDEYPRLGGVNSRVLIWFVTQQHTYFGGFVLALPLFCVILEFLGLRYRDREMARWYDLLAREVMKVVVLALSITATLGAVLLGLLILLYPSFMTYMGGTFRSLMPVYAGVFMAESLLLIGYYYSWERLAQGAYKWLHAAIGVLANVVGTSLLFLANAWAAFMMAPAGVDDQGRFLGNVWHILHSPLWNPLNAHRFLADIMSGGAVVIAFAAYRFLVSKSSRERAYYDWVSFVFFIVTVCALLPMPFAGYWLMQSVYEFRQQMGMTMMGGLLTWLFVIQALTIGVLFLGINYYMWQALGRFHDGLRYQRYCKYLACGLLTCFVIWLTPHTLLVTASEVKEMGGAQHPVIGNYGVMSAKNGAINVMICLTVLSFLFYKRANRVITVPWASMGNFALGILFTAGMVNIIWLAVYGFYLPANIRIGLSVPQALTTLTVLIGGVLVNKAMLRDAPVKGPIAWGRISIRGMGAAFAIAATFTWVMGLMGYIRSSGRLNWHVHEIMPDLSPWAFTPSLFFAAKMVTINMLIFWGSVFLMFWMAGRLHHITVKSPAPRVEDTPIVQALSREEST